MCPLKKITTEKYFDSLYFLKIGEAAAASSSQQRIEQLDTAVWKDTEGVIGGDTTLKDYHDVEKFAQFYLPKDNPKLLEDLEVGSDTNEHYLEPEAIYSTFLRKPTSPSTEHDKDVRADVISEITSNKTPPKPKSILVPKAALPVVIDENAEGKATIETVTAWKVREGIEKILSENDKYWSHKLERVTAKAEREMNQEVEKFEKRLRNIEVHHGFSISSPLRRGSHCNMLTSQIGKCYQKNPDEVLKCDTLVRQFAQCTNNAMLAKGVIKK